VPLDSPSLARWLWLAWLISWFAAALWSDRTIGRPSLGRQVLFRLPVIAGADLLFGMHSGGRPTGALLWHPGAASGWALLGLTVAGLAFTWWARLHIGRLWSSSVTRKADHRVVDTGPYAIVRHPIYTGIIVAAFATAFLPPTLLTIAGAACIALGAYVKARVEEGFLREQLGEDAYAAYARRVPMLVPFLKV
jgi:protein-S-isoprenylcysteine O-methyltransferase Ste14